MVITITIDAFREHADQTQQEGHNQGEVLSEKYTLMYHKCDAPPEQ
jgi:hypothetical protein